MAVEKLLARKSYQTEKRESIQAIASVIQAFNSIYTNQYSRVQPVCGGYSSYSWQEWPFNSSFPFEFINKPYYDTLSFVFTYK